MNIFLCAFLLVSLAHPALADGIEEKFFNLERSDAGSRKVSMDFKDAALMDVLKIFSQQSGMNFITAQDVSARKVTLFMENIPVKDALDKILDANDLTYAMDPDSDVFIVRSKPSSKGETVTRVYPLKYASVPSSKIKNTISITNNSLSSSLGGSSAIVASAPSSFGSSGASASSSSGGIFAAVKAVLSKSGTLVEDARTNSLIVTDVESQFGLIEETIAKLDVPVPQILIEVEMLDVSKTTSDLMGVKFGNSPFSFKGPSKDTFIPFDQREVLNEGGTVAYTAGTISTVGMTAVVNFLRTRLDTRNLARPRLLTLNNETAEIKISTNEAVGISSITASSQSTSTQTQQAERVQTGVFLTVTPQANLLTREILMAVYPKVIQARTGATFGTQTFKDPEERGSQSILKVHDGETIIIGGLLRRDDSNTITKLPILGDIPFLGMAFRHKDKSNTERELIIFMTPHIIDENNKQKLLFAPEVPGKGTFSLDRIDTMNKELSSMEPGK
ncbi:secretin N-terminal domain-containing protein [Phenylobacterium sp.]|uniref:secretin N-terminal domain-containing protein n=1 Tax=Phenylobacterium sp. TaxID=1871053 RepID=UPI0027236F99|nr:secretin N-terminal domain-containing protein [Phenylobacterium sp.]MDO8801781.1 secretin N-terminal domain-containing protein [Phenylobacterium sp.]